MAIVVGDIDVESARRVQGEIAAGPGAAVAVEVDSPDRNSLRRLAEAATATYGGVHVLATTVGVILERALAEATDADWDWLLQLNVMAQVRAIDVFLPLLREADGPTHIVVTAAGAGLVPAAGGSNLGLYAATKHALVGYGEMLRYELEPQGIGVSVLCPSGVMGKLAETSARSRLRHLGAAAGNPGGHQPTGRRLVPNEVIGPLVAEAIRRNRLYVFNRPGDVRAAVEDHRRGLLDDIGFWEGWGETSES